MATSSASFQTVHLLCLLLQVPWCHLPFSHSRLADAICSLGLSACDWGQLWESRAFRFWRGVPVPWSGGPSISYCRGPFHGNKNSKATSSSRVPVSIISWAKRWWRWRGMHLSECWGQDTEWPQWQCEEWRLGWLLGAGSGSLPGWLFHPLAWTVCQNGVTLMPTAFFHTGKGCLFLQVHYFSGPTWEAFSGIWQTRKGRSCSQRLGCSA